MAYYDVLSNRIVMYEETALWKIKPDLALQQALATIAHEGRHQILHNIGVQQRLSHVADVAQRRAGRVLRPHDHRPHS